MLLRISPIAYRHYTCQIYFIKIMLIISQIPIIDCWFPNSSDLLKSRSACNDSRFTLCETINTLQHLAFLTKYFFSFIDLQHRRSFQIQLSLSCAANICKEQVCNRGPSCPLEVSQVN